MKKISFIFKGADTKTRILGIVALALAALAILTVFLSARSAIHGDFTEISIIKFTVSEDDIDEFKDDCKNLKRQIKNAINEDDDYTLSEIKAEYKMSAKKLLKLLDPISLNSLKVISARSSHSDYMLFSVIIGVINGYAFLLILFVALSSLFMNRGFFIASSVLSAIFFFVLVGALGFFIFLALCIAYCILVSKVHDAYIIFKNTPVVTETVSDTEEATA